MTDKKKIKKNTVIEEMPEMIQISTDDTLPENFSPEDGVEIVPLKNNVFFSKTFSPILMLRDKSIKIITEKYQTDKIIGIFTQINQNINDPAPEDLYKYGTLAKIIKIITLPDGEQSALIQGLKHIKITSFVKKSKFLKARVKIIETELAEVGDKEFEAVIKNIREKAEELITMIESESPESLMPIEDITDNEMLINHLCSNLNFDIKEKIKLLRIKNLKKRGFELLKILNIEIQKQQIKEDINYKVHKNLSKSQKEFFLQQQLNEIQKELGDDPVQKEIAELKARAKNKKWSTKIKDIFNKELHRLEVINHMSPEYGIQLSYLQTILDLPWNVKTKDNYDMKRTQEILDEEHYGLEKVKERILEHIAVLKLKGDLKSPIICLYGPPGVGKTSLGKSIATALNRNYIRMSLGGLHDEAEIRGHRKTYIGAMPGRIIQSLKKAKSSNPVFVLDEIDKISSDFRGSPASALLEVLDPEQNNTFYDNYLEFEYDLSDVMFIATANSLSTVSPTLLDRMELIEMTGYLLEEKIEIAKRHLIPKQLEAHGVKTEQCEIKDDILKFLIENYTRESGVRELDKKIASIIRKIAKEIAFGNKISKIVSKTKIIEFLGAPKFTKTSYEDCEIAGVATGLAWTPAGGEIMSLEAIASRGNGKLSMTGNLGKVMSESAAIAFEYIKAHYADLKLHPLVFKYWNVHFHAPEGAIPKDGPSAGITITTALASLFTQRKIKPFLALTGEITLSGKVLPVGGIKEKILAAKRAGIKEIILSEKNKADIDEIKSFYIQGLKFHFVKNMEQVLQIALLNEKVSKQIKIGIPKNLNNNHSKN